MSLFKSQVLNKLIKKGISILYWYFNLSRTLFFLKNLCYLLDWKPFKNDEKCFLFHLKSSFRFQDDQVSVTIFGHAEKSSKFMTSQRGLQTIAIHLLPNISQSKGNQTMKFGQLIEYIKRNIFLQKLCGKWGRETTIIMDIIFWDFLIPYQIFFSPQVKRTVIISNKHGIYELPYELPNDLRLRKF